MPVIREVEGDEICVVLPNSLIGGNEPGDPLSNGVIALILTLVNLHYFPLEFGETDLAQTELWFEKALTPAEAQRNTIHFIKMRGDV
jgi:hypothetical protein